MILNDNQLHELTQKAITAARTAGRVINAYRHTEIQVHRKKTGTSTAAQVVTEVDYKAQAAILEILEPTCSEYTLALLTEESPDNSHRLKKPAFWSIDPMDGTLNFINNTPGYSVSIGLVARDGSPLIGVVYDPVQQNLYHAIRGQGAYKNREPMQIPELNPQQALVLRTDFSFQTHLWLKQTQTGLEDISRKMGLNGADIQYRNGAVLNACEILAAPNICYFKYPRTGNSGGSLWDYAATACLYHETGAIASDIFGHSMELNRPDSTFMNQRGLLYAGHQSLAEHIIALHNKLQMSE